MLACGSIVTRAYILTMVPFVSSGTRCSIWIQPFPPARFSKCSVLYIMMNHLAAILAQPFPSYTGFFKCLPFGHTKARSDHYVKAAAASLLCLQFFRLCGAVHGQYHHDTISERNRLFADAA